MNLETKEMLQAILARMDGMETRFDEKLGGMETRFDEKMDGVETWFDKKL